MTKYNWQSPSKSNGHGFSLVKVFNSLTQSSLAAFAAFNAAQGNTKMALGGAALVVGFALLDGITHRRPS